MFHNHALDHGVVSANRGASAVIEKAKNREESTTWNGPAKIVSVGAKLSF